MQDIGADVTCEQSSMFYLNVNMFNLYLFLYGTTSRLYIYLISIKFLFNVVQLVHVHVVFIINKNVHFYSTDYVY